jgi:hypothetical protein
LCLKGVSFLKPLYLEEGTSLICEVSESSGIKFSDTAGRGNRTVYCTVEEISTMSLDLVDQRPFMTSLVEAKKHGLNEIHGVAERYNIANDDYILGPKFQTLQQVWQSSKGVKFLARLRVLLDSERYQCIHTCDS